jgi:hypothetical protein
LTVHATIEQRRLMLYKRNALSKQQKADPAGTRIGLLCEQVRQFYLDRRGGVEKIKYGQKDGGSIQMSNESKRQVHIDQQIGQVTQQFSTIIQELRNTLQHEMELEEEVQAYREAKSDGRTRTIGNYGRYANHPDIIRCPRAKSDMTPCAARDGDLACLDTGACVGCERHPANLLKELVKDLTRT